jgi:predicted membrane channel-forming protein YqfA (hemolysin III family)
MRRAWTITFVVVGIVLMLVGYALAAPWGATSEANSNPTMDFAALIFVLGVMVFFSSALVYELIPSDRD